MLDPSEQRVSTCDARPERDRLLSICARFSCTAEREQRPTAVEVLVSTPRRQAGDVALVATDPPKVTRVSRITRRFELADALRVRGQGSSCIRERCDMVLTLHV